MKKSDLEKLLKEQSAAVLPADETRKRIKRDLGIVDLPAEEKEAERDFAYAPAPAAAGAGRRTGATRNGQRHLPLPAVIAFAAVAVLLIVAIVFSLLPKNTPLPKPGGTADKFSEIKTTDDFYAYGAASVGTLLRSSGTSAATAYASAAFAAAPLSAQTFGHSALFAQPRAAYGNQAESGLTEEQIETLNRYMPLAEELLSDGKIAHADTTVPAALENEYAYGMKVSYTELTGGAVTYYMYYNKIMLSSDSEDGESEEEYALEGVLVVEGMQYAVKGEQEIEIEEDESESEMSFTAVTGQNSTLRVHREYETEGSETEQKFIYTVTENGKETESVELEYEQEDGETELKMTVRRDGEEDVLTLRNRSENGNLRFTAQGRIGGKDVSFTVEIVTDASGNTSYVYTLDDQQFDFDRPDFDDDEDDDEDDEDEDDDRRGNRGD